jgi:hypothetical protein
MRKTEDFARIANKLSTRSPSKTYLNPKLHGALDYALFAFTNTLMCFLLAPTIWISFTLPEQDAGHPTKRWIVTASRLEINKIGPLLCRHGVRAVFRSDMAVSK